MGKRFAIVMKQRIRIAGATLAVAAGLIGAAAATAGTPDPPSTQDPYYCYGVKPTIVGTSGNDALHGTPRGDVIAGGDGRDSLKAKSGNDVLCGGAGNDTLKGGTGNDELDGQSGNDTLNGGGGPKDFCVGGTGNDSPENPHESPPSSSVSGCEQRSIH